MAEGRLFDGYGDDGNFARLRQTTGWMRHGVRLLPLAGEKSFKLNNDPMVTKEAALAQTDIKVKFPIKGPSFGSCVTRLLLFLERDLDCKF